MTTDSADKPYKRKSAMSAARRKETKNRTPEEISRQNSDNAKKSWETRTKADAQARQELMSKRLAEVREATKALQDNNMPAIYNILLRVKNRQSSKMHSYGIESIAWEVLNMFFTALADKAVKAQQVDTYRITAEEIGSFVKLATLINTSSTTRITNRKIKREIIDSKRAEMENTIEADFRLTEADIKELTAYVRKDNLNAINK